MKNTLTKKQYILGVVIIGMFIFSGVVVGHAAHTTQKYIKTLVRAEHMEHYVKLRTHVWELAHAFGKLSTYDAIIEERLLKDTEKDEIKVILRDMEEAGLNIARRNMFYNEDTTAHMFLPPEKKIDDFFDESRNTQLYIERCVRFVETGLTLPYPNQKQKDSVREQCQLLSDEIMRLKAFTR